jgi:hypothetical protein
MPLVVAIWWRSPERLGTEGLIIESAPNHGLDAAETTACDSRCVLNPRRG